MTWLIVAICIAGVFIFYFLKKMAPVHTMTMFLANYNLRLEQDGNPKTALVDTVEFFRYRKPFSLLQDSDVRSIAEAVDLLAQPDKVCAALFQAIENDPEKAMSLFRSNTLLYRWAFLEDLTAGLIDIMERAKQRAGSTADITRGIMLSLPSRPGWTVRSEDSNSFLFSYNEMKVLINKTISGMQIAKLVLSTELQHRASHLDNIVNLVWLEDALRNFDEYFSAAVDNIRAR